MSDPNQTSEHVRAASGPESTGAYVPSGADARVVALLDQYLADLQAGKAPDKVKLLADHADLAGPLEQCLSGIDFVHRAASSQADMPAHLGDFKIIREVGHGGMGVVYEAEQISLKRKVALKVLRFGAVADGELMKRFQREAETVAHLHHTNIVPIHAVGCEGGVNYYAMQFIEGMSLAEVMKKPAGGVASDFHRIADWALQAAEALAHAHQRGVIHRDIKPSNLILDLEGIVWLTDFGLAKRADEVTLTAAGVLMGTPRYMSPEQAASARQPIDHRTDIYSLGATLYELATTRPVFDAQTPQGVITQILNSEPIAPRLILKELPRDLETIILKCLAKEPEKRYQQARDLADDLRSFLEGRPIKARRIGLVERSVRWAKKRRASAVIAASAAAVAVGLLVAGDFGWSAYAEAQLGHLTLTTDGPALVAEILSDDDEPIVPGFPVPNAKAVTLPAGAHRLRLSAPGQLSETWDIDVEKGRRREFAVKMFDRTLGSTLDIRGPEAPVLVELNGQSHLLYRAERGWRLVNGATMNPAWQNDLKYPEKPEAAPYPDSHAQRDSFDLLQALYWGQQSRTEQSPGVVQPAVDLNGDGKDDLIFASRVSPSLLAVSGTDGKVLWWYRAAVNFPEGHDADKDPLDPKASREDAGVIRQPAIAKIDGEVFVIAAFVSHRATLRTKSGKMFGSGPTCYVDAVNARTGKRAWRRMLDLPPFTSNMPIAFARGFPPRPEIARLGGKSVVVLGVGKDLFGFDVKTGQDAWPALKLPSRLIQPVQMVGSNDGVPFAVAVHGNLPQIVVHAIALPSGQTLWERTFANPLNNAYVGPEPAEFPLVWLADLDRDGKTQIIVPLGFDFSRKTNRALGIEVLDGKTGATRWQRTLRRFAGYSSSETPFDAPVRIAVGPDLDGDGSAEVFVVSSGGRELPAPADANTFLQIDALSGKDGSVLWRRQRNFSTAMRTFTIPRPIQWWQPGSDGWPQLVVPIERGPGGQAVTYVVSAGTGRVAHVLPGASFVEVADLNNDGLADLYYLTWTKGPRLLTALKGLPPLEWRRTGNFEPGADFDGDGVTDLIDTGRDDPTLEAVSGRDGHPLWRSMSYRAFTRTLSVDVDGDGVVDVVVVERAPYLHTSLALAAYSGKDGRLLWRAPIAQMQPGSTNSSGIGPLSDFQYPLLDYVDLDGNGRPEILIAGIFADAGLCLAVFSGQDGHFLWKASMLQSAFTGRSLIDRHLFHDLDGDGVRDVVLWTPEKVDSNGQPTGALLRAFSGRDGKPLWTADLAERAYFYPRVAIADLHGDGKPAVVLTTIGNKFRMRKDCELLVLDGKNGHVNWRWPGTPNESWNDICPPLLVDIHGDGKRAIALGIQRFANGNQEFKIHLFDAKGKIIPVEPPGLNPQLAHVWTAFDIDGAGKESLIYRTASGVLAFDLGENKIRWKWDRSAPDLFLEGIRNDGAGKAPELAVWDWGAAHGIDTRTGAQHWRCDIPLQDGFINFKKILFAPNAAVRPLILTRDSNQPIWSLQRAMPVDAAGRYQPAASPRSQVAPEPFIDYRPLPCTRLQGGFSSLVIGLGPLLLILAYWSIRRYWRRVLLFSTLTIFTAAALAVPAVGSVMGAGEMPLEPDERYSWQGWYGGLWLAAVLVLYVIVLWTLASWAFGFIRKLARAFWSRAKATPR